jgi:hypothetical protein
MCSRVVAEIEISIASMFEAAVDRVVISAATD